MEEKKIVKYKLVRHKWPDEIEAEKKIRRRKMLTVASCIICFLLGFFASNVVPHLATSKTSDEMEKFDDIYNIMSKKWYFGKDVDDLNNTLMTSAINGMIGGGEDPHTIYMDAVEAADFTSSLEGNFVGIGVQYYALNEKTFIIDKVFKNSPAETAGIIKGDQIFSINGEACEGMSIDDIASKIKGDAGTNVELEILREGKTVPMNVVRGEVKSSVYGEFHDKVGVLEISTFAESSGEEVGAYLKDFKAQGADQLIIDLRDNGGGYLKAAQEIISYLLPSDTVIFKELDKDGNYKEYMTLPDHEQYSFHKIVVLVNNSTASASEVLTMALQEKVNAEVVGVNTYGKGTVQVSLPFADGSSIKYTTAEWTSPSGTQINGVGIKPNYEVSLDPAITTGAPKLEEDVVIKEDTVSVAAKSVQIYLKFLGYSVDRTDMYFSIKSAQALRNYQSDNGMEVTGEINTDVIAALLSSCSLKWHNEQSTLDLQMMKAMEVVHGT